MLIWNAVDLERKLEDAFGDAVNFRMPPLKELLRTTPSLQQCQVLLNRLSILRLAIKL